MFEILHYDYIVINNYNKIIGNSIVNEYNSKSIEIIVSTRLWAK